MEDDQLANLVSDFLNTVYQVVVPEEDVAGNALMHVIRICWRSL